MKKEKLNVASGDKIKSFMKENGYTAEKLSKKIGKDKRAYFNKIKSETEFTLTEAWIMTKLFDCTLDDLVKDYSELSDVDKKKVDEILSIEE